MENSQDSFWSAQFAKMHKLEVETLFVKMQHSYWSIWVMSFHKFAYRFNIIPELYKLCIEIATKVIIAFNLQKLRT